MEVSKSKIRNREQHKKPNKKKKGYDTNNEYFNKLSADIITSILVRFLVKTLSMLRSREHTLGFVSVEMEGDEESNEEELCAVIVPGRRALHEWLACCGLICILIDCRIYLCNPAIQQVCELPEWLDLDIIIKRKNTK